MLNVLQPRKYWWHVPFPWRGDVNEIEIGATTKVFEIAFAVTVDRGCFLTRLFDHLSRPQAFLFNCIAYGVNYNLVDREEFPKHAGATQPDADDTYAHHVPRLKLHPNHRFLSSPVSAYLRSFTFINIVCVPDARGSQAQPGNAGGLQ